MAKYGLTPKFLVAKSTWTHKRQLEQLLQQVTTLSVSHEQNWACSSYAMARKSAMQWNSFAGTSTLRGHADQGLLQGKQLWTKPITRFSGWTIKKACRKNEKIGLGVLLQCCLLIKENDPNNGYGRNNASQGWRGACADYVRFWAKKMSVFEEIAYAIRLDGEKWLFLHGGSLDVQKAWSMGLLVFIH